MAKKAKTKKKAAPGRKPVKRKAAAPAAPRLLDVTMTITGEVRPGGWVAVKVSASGHHPDGWPLEEHVSPTQAPDLMAGICRSWLRLNAGGADNPRSARPRGIAGLKPG